MELDRARTRPAGTPPPERRRRQGTRLAVILAGILGVVLAAWAGATALGNRGQAAGDVQAAPSGAAAGLTRAAGDGPVSATIPAGRFSVELLIEPARVGANQVHVTVYAADGNLANVGTLRATLTPPGERTGPSEITMNRVAANHFLAPAAPTPVAGDWQLLLTMRVQETDSESEAVVGPDQDVKAGVIVPVR
jgi:copper transport protein